MMKKNMGKIDRTIRLVVVAIIGVLYFTGTVTGTLGIILLVAAGVFTMTLLTGWCPIYSLLGLKTCKA